MRNPLLKGSHKNQRAEAVALAILGLVALFAIGGAFWAVIHL